MPSGLTLYEITDTLPVLLDSLEMTEAGTPERAECEAEIMRYFEALPQKVDGVARILAHFEAQAKFASEEIKRLQTRKGRFDRAAERLESYAIAILERLPEPKRGPKKLEGATSTLSLRKCPASLRITDESQIPARFRVVIPATSAVCNAAVKDALKAGESVPGAELVTDKHRLGVA